MKLILLRHGETEANRKEVIGGQTDDPLTERGIKQAKKAALRLKEEKLDRIYVSDLRRAIDTAREVIAYHPDVEVIYEPLLRETHGGEFEGMPYGSIARAAEKAGVPRDDFKPNGGESLKEFRARSEKFMEMIAKKERGKTILVVTHGGTIANIIIQLFGAHDENFKNFLPHNTAITIIELDFTSEQNKHNVLTLNCVKHLL